MSAMTNRLDTSRPAREHLLLQTYKQFDENPPMPEIAALRDGAKQFVPGAGSFTPKAILIGEAPGAREDQFGAPFVGKSGRFLDELLLAANLSRDEVWITNVVKYRPKANRTPDPVEIDASLSLLRRELALVAGDQCRLIVGLGRVACCAVAGKPISVTQAHGSVRSLKGDWRLFISYHPSAGLRDKGTRRAMIADFDVLGQILKGRDA
jgi:uracil-DNA glycosylase